MSDTLALVAPQSTSNAALVPCAVGWSIQLFLCGISTSQTFQILQKRRRYFSHHKTDGYLLKSALAANLLVSSLLFWDIIAWMTTQERDTPGLFAYKKPDTVWPFFSALVSCITQVFMARRCHRLVRRGAWFLFLMAFFILAAMAGSIWGTVTSTLFSLGKGSDKAMFVPTQVWLWSSVAIDVLITAALSLRLSGMKQGFSSDTDNFINAIIRVAFETCAAPLFFTICSAICYAATWNNHLLWNLYAATSSFLPSVYLLSFVYCVEATHASKELYESSRSGGVSGPQSDVEKGDKAPRSRNALSIPVNKSGHPQHSISWAPPLDWHSVPGEPEPVLLFSETPFARYASTESDAVNGGTPDDQSKQPTSDVKGISIITETHTQVDYHPAIHLPDECYD